jgi:DivIVA domain-containing protein
MSPEEVHAIAFRRPAIGRRGYDEEDVDRLLDRIEETLRGQSQITREELTRLQLGNPPIGKRGYRKEDVDAFIQRALADWSIWRWQGR